MDGITIVLQSGMWHMGDGWGWWMMFGWLWMIVFWGLIVWGGVYIARRLTGRDASGGTSSNALNILQERYARGELSDEEFEAKRRRLLDM